MSFESWTNHMAGVEMPEELPEQEDWDKWLESHIAAVDALTSGNVSSVADIYNAEDYESGYGEYGLHALIADVISAETDWSISPASDDYTAVVGIYSSEVFPWSPPETVNAGLTKEIMQSLIDKYITPLYPDYPPRFSENIELHMYA